MTGNKIWERDWDTELKIEGWEIVVYVNSRVPSDKLYQWGCTIYENEDDLREDISKDRRKVMGIGGSNGHSG